MIGERIKALRKQKKMTQTQLAEGIVTKSMLSMIENGKAEASMRSLRELASRLDVSVQFLLKDSRESELQKLVEEIEYADMGFMKWDNKDIIERLEPFLDSDMQSIWLGRAYVFYGDAILTNDNRDLVLNYYDRAIELFERLGEKDEIAMTRIGQAYYLMHWDRFDEAGEKIELIEQLDSQAMKTKTRIEFYMLLVFKELLYNAQLSHAIQYLQEALNYMKQTRTYYRADDVYRALVICALYRKENELIQKAIMKARQYVDFTEDDSSRMRLAFTEGLVAMKQNNVDLMGVQLNIIEEILQKEESYMVIKEEKRFITPFEMFKGVYHAMKGDIEKAEVFLNELWERRNEWQLKHSLIDQAIYLEGLLLGTLYGCGNQWLEEIEILIDQFPEGYYHQNLTGLLIKIKG
ncbi:helix-turn-helix domain-containing protein [Exiguobacterium sp. B2(2022)]|uniref:helix-turn-helix domain-containing protein n=1 Tax=Exiguobacterium sp. B2(2022) TaxID=2992755 RepID=UPI00237AE722|nr:helix-turn-helix transcriptional regulator [Exiguobacterium sp. B2(2022)]MDE0564533.1 helix-turn-helix domain-containing protein [Exiguobacterium sp. B2(2022)]